MPTPQADSLAVQRKRIHSLCADADERRLQGRYGEAEPPYRQALALAESVCGRDHPEVATLCNNLAVLLKKLRKYDEAVALYRRALAILKRRSAPSIRRS